MKRCTKCKKKKKLSEFSKNRSNKDGYTYRCKVCISKRGKAYRKTHPKDSQAIAKQKVTSRRYYQEKGRQQQVEKIYGANVNYNDMFDRQKGCCAICGTHQSVLKHALQVDHNHQTKKVRELLCRKHNLGLGDFEEDVELLQAAINYLKRHE